MSKDKILVVDDEAAIRKLLEITLQTHDYAVAHAITAREALAMAASHPPDLILLDIGLPDRSGQDLLKDLRTWYSQPIIVLSVQSDEQSIVSALDNGASDYLVKPFRTGELLARIRSALRIRQSADTCPELVIGDLVINLAQRMVRKRHEVIKLTATEYDLLALLARHEGRVLTHPFLLKEVWGPGYVGQSQYLRVFVAQLRKKIEDDPNRPKYLVTESGIGYRMIAPGNQ